MERTKDRECKKQWKAFLGLFKNSVFFSFFISKFVLIIFYNIYRENKILKIQILKWITVVSLSD